MSYADLTQSIISSEFYERAIDVAYNGQETSGIFRFIGIDEDGARSANEVSRADQATLILLKSEVDKPSYNHKVVVDGHTWKVIKPLKGGGSHTHKVLIERNRGRVR